MITRLANQCALTKFDDGWQKAVEQSIIGRAVSALPGKSPSAAGSLLQKLSFAIVCLLVLAIGMPQFANDKEGLALIVVAGLAAWIGGRFLGGKDRLTFQAPDILVLAFLAINIVAAFSSHYLLPSLRGLAKEMVYVLSYFLFAAILGHSPKRQLVLVSLMLTMGLAVSLYGLYQYKIGVQPLATWEDPTVEVQGTRIYSTLGNPNLLAGYLIPMCPLAFSLGIQALTKRKYLLSALPFLASAIFAVATLLTGSRGGYLGIAAAALAFLAMGSSYIWQEKPKSRILIALIAIVIPLIAVAAAAFIPTFNQRVTSMFAGREHSSNSFRLNVWHSSFAMFEDNWWLGVGIGNQAFRLAYGLYMKSGFDALGTYCVPLEVAVETGVSGLAVFALIVVCLFARAHVLFWQAGEMRNQANRWLIAGSVSALCGLLVQGFVDTVFYRPQVHFIFWLLTAIIFAGFRPSQRQSNEPSPQSEQK